MSHGQRYRVRVGERTIDVKLDGPSTQGGTRVTVGENTYEVFDGPDGALLVGDDSPTQTTVWLEPGGNPASAMAGGTVFEVELQSAQQAALAEALAASGGGASAGTVLTAPMPGRVVKVLVETEATVEEGQPLVIVEAMKMENELRASTRGTVALIKIAAGDTVDAGQVLLELQPHDAPS